MDHFGIGQAVEGMLLTYIQASRGTGRTTSLIESLKDGDRVVSGTADETRRLDRMCKERGLKVTCITVDPKTPDRLFETPTSEGRTIFEHTWVETYYMLAIRRCRADIDHIQRQTSGMGTAHEETRMKAREIVNWRP